MRTRSTGVNSSPDVALEQAITNLNDRLDSVSHSVKNVKECVDVITASEGTSTLPPINCSGEDALILRKHVELLTEWEALQKEVRVLRDELKEDKWRNVFRTVTDQSDGMMSSLEKSIFKCQVLITVPVTLNMLIVTGSYQEFIFNFQNYGHDDEALAPSKNSTRSHKPPLTFEAFTAILDSYEARKKFVAT